VQKNKASLDTCGRSSIFRSQLMLHRPPQNIRYGICAILYLYRSKAKFKDQEQRSRTKVKNKGQEQRSRTKVKTVGELWRIRYAHSAVTAPPPHPLRCAINVFLNRKIKTVGVLSINTLSRIYTSAAPPPHPLTTSKPLSQKHSKP